MDIIIGSGITGLSYANFCGHGDYLILEKDNEPGGYCKTIKKDGFIWDYSGHFFHFRNPEIEKFLLDRMGEEKVFKVVRKAQIKFKNKLVDFPFQKNIHQLGKKDFINCLYDLFKKDEKESYKSFKEMLYGKFGKSISEMFLIPYNEKLYGCDLNTLDVNAMGRFFPYAEKEEIILNFNNKNNNSYNSTFTYPKNGAFEYIKALLKNIDNEKISYNEKIINIDPQNKKITTNIRELKYTRLISTMPFIELMKLCNIPYDESLYSWNKVLVFNLGFDKKGKDVSNHWIYFPEKKYCFYRVGFYDNIIYESRMSLYVELGFSNDVELNIESIKENVLRDLKKAGIVVGEKLISYHTVVMNPAYVHVNNLSEEDKKQKKIELEKHKIYSIGRYGDWKYCSIEDNIIEAKELAEQIKNEH